LALISVGAGNSYGHPAASTVADLERLHAKVLRTDRDGAVAVEVHHHAVSFEREKSRPRWISWN
jgi:competence protein ComEC